MNNNGHESRPIIGEAPAFLAMMEHVSRAATLNKPVLVIGERGTGKELVAARLHYLSPRWEQPLVKVNCAALPESILESELFGHQAGAFTGATRDHMGRFERADGGTLFLDELGTIPPRMQEKILRVIEYGEFERVGGSSTIRVNVRIVGATNEDLPLLAREGRFRADLLDRLAFDVIKVPPLRHRQEDILALAHAFALNITSELGRLFFPGFSVEATARLLAYPWPGNVRELKNAVERSVYRCLDPDSPIEDIVFDPFDSPYSRADQGPVPGHARKTEEQESGNLPVTLPMDLKTHISDLEIRALEDAMHLAQYKQASAARLLGLSYDQFRGLLRKHKLVKKFGRNRR
jgi:psp operon transcriptional activator